MFSWLRRRRRVRILATPFPEHWLGFLERNVAHYAYLSEAEQAKLRDDLLIFVAEKYWEGCGGLIVTEEMQVTIAAQACLLVLNRQHEYYRRSQSVLVYPHGYVAPEARLGVRGVIDQGGSARLGESWYRGPVVLSWDDAKRGGSNAGDGVNLVFHEFAHQLDMLNGEADGLPPIENREQQDHWSVVVAAEYEKLVAQAHSRRATLLDKYGATNPAEFFAVATECFFERPVELEKRHEEFYGLMRDFFGQDPAGRMRHHAGRRKQAPE